MANDNNYTNLNPLGEDSIKGGIFFGSSLTPAGTFSNVPRFIKQDQIATKEAALVLTLQKVKDSIKSNLQEETGGGTTSDDSIEKFLYDFTGLLIDYRDLRNYIFYGSSNTELAYNIKYIIENYPYNTLVGQKFGSSFIKLNNFTANSREYTEILFPERYFYADGTFDRIILDNFNRFNYYDDDSTVNWNNYEVVDKNARRYKILKVTTPYKSSTIFKVKQIQNVTATGQFGLTYNTIRVTLSSDPTNVYQLGMPVEFTELAAIDPTKAIVAKVIVPGDVYNDVFYYDLNKEKFQITNMGTTNSDHWIEIRRADAKNPYEDLFLEDYEYVAPLTQLYQAESGIIRKYPLSENAGPFWIKVLIEGRLASDNFMLFTFGREDKAGFMISPKVEIINEWDLQLTPIQKQLLAPSPLNPTPWPRRPITGNIQNIADNDDREEDFFNWLTSPTSMYVQQGNEEIDTGYGQDLYYEYRLVRALVLDESYSNQIIRRMIPHDIISELNDTEDFYFQRFLLIAGWFFDQVRLYVKFIKYTHTLNYTEFDQLSPEFYRHYSDYYGLDLFSDDSIDFSKIVIKTEPGYYYIDDASQLNNKYYRQTLQQQQYERQKRLLLSLFYLYKIKGTQACINQLISLLGAPEGFLAFNEYAFAVDNRDTVGYPINKYTGTRIVDNDKVHTPGVTFEIDTNYLIDKANISNPINKPYVYKQFLDNEYVHNLREISVHTDPNGAIDKQIQNVFGAQRSNYVTFGVGEFATLQNTDYHGEYFFLPLSLPDRFYGFSVDYMIPRNGMRKGVGQDTEEANINLLALYKINNTDIPQKPTLGITAITLSNNETEADITTDNPHNYVPGENVFISGVAGINGINNIMFTVQSILSPTQFTILGDFSDQWQGGGQVISGELTRFVNSHSTSAIDDPSTLFVDEEYVAKSMDFIYPLAVTFDKRNAIGDNAFAKDSNNTIAVDGYTNPSTDFDILKKRYPTAVWVENSYVIVRLEGDDLVFRMNMDSELSTSVTGDCYPERVAIFENFFKADGLNHSLRMLFREEGVEVYQDYEFKGIARWMRPNAIKPYKAYEIPKSEIKMMANYSDMCFSYFEPIKTTDFVANEPVGNHGIDKINWWDMFVGMPHNIDFWFHKLSFFENNTINDYDIGDRITNAEEYTAEFYVFEPANPEKGSTKERGLQSFSLPAVFDPKVPNAVPEYYGYALPQAEDQYNRNIIPLLQLRHNHCYNETGLNLLLNKQQDFFKFQDVFRDNAWQKDIHKTYEYDLFNGDLHKLYLLYSAQVLSYESLEEFLDLVEGKFKGAFQQFIPIVINLLEFGRMIKNSIYNQAKYRIPGSDKYCQGVYLNNKSFMSTRLWTIDNIQLDGLVPGQDIEFNILTHGGQDIITATTVAWDTNKYITSVDLVNTINHDPNNVGGIWHASFTSEQFRLEVDYDLFLATYGESANNIFIMFWQNGTTDLPAAGPFSFDLAYGNPSGLGAHAPEYNHCGDLMVAGYNDSEVCGSVTYSLPGSAQLPVWLYFESEGKPAIYPRFAAELSGDTIFVKKDGE